MAEMTEKRYNEIVNSTANMSISQKVATGKRGIFTKTDLLVIAMELSIVQMKLNYIAHSESYGSTTRAYLQDIANDQAVRINVLKKLGGT